MTATRIVNTNTADLVKAMAEGCCERAISIRKRSKLPITHDAVIHEVNTMALNYFIGACACAAALGIPELEAHLKHVLMTEVSVKGYVAVEQLATGRRS